MVTYSWCGEFWPTCVAHLVFRYEILQSIVLYYTDKLMSVNYKPMEEISYLNDFVQEPSIIFREYEVFHWQIRMPVYDKLIFVLEKMRFKNANESHIMIHEGPSQYVEELCIFKRYLTDGESWSPVETQTFQAVVSLTWKRSNRLNHNNVISYRRIQDESLSGAIHQNVSRESEQIQFPSSDCRFSVPVTLCQWYLAAPVERYISLTIDELTHKAPIDKQCSYLGVSVINVPAHVTGVSLNTFWIIGPLVPKQPQKGGRFHNHRHSWHALHYAHDFYLDLYDQHLFCHMDMLLPLSMNNDPSRTVYTSSPYVLITIYLYTPFIDSTPRIVLTLASSKYQNAPLHLLSLRNYPHMDRFYYIKPKNIFLSYLETEEDKIEQHTLMQCYLQAKYVPEYEEPPNELKTRYLHGLFFPRKNLADEQWQYSYYLHYESFLQCFSVGSDINFMLMSVKRNKLIVTSFFPGKHDFNDNVAKLYISREDNWRSPVHLSLCQTSFPL